MLRYDTPFVKVIEEALKKSGSYLDLYNENYCIKENDTNFVWFVFTSNDAYHNKFLKMLEFHKITHQSMTRDGNYEIDSDYMKLYNHLIDGLNRKNKIKRVLKKLNNGNI